MSVDMEKIRKSAVAGQFYSDNSTVLKGNIQTMLDLAPKAVGRVRAVISPHAGYVYSGKTAAKGFSLLRGEVYDRIIVIAPSHRIAFPGVAIADFTAYSTPLGDVMVDNDAVDEIEDSANGGITKLNDAHTLEHALEVQLPFLQEALPDTPIVPLICGHTDERLLDSIAHCLLPFWTSHNLWVISSDFTHFGDAFNYVPFVDDVENKLKALDMGAIEKILSFDGAGFAHYVQNTGATICGAKPIEVLLKIIKLAECSDFIRSELLEYSNSGELSGDFSHCVGYASIVFSE